MADQADDLALVEAWRRGDASAGEALFRKYFKAVSRFFRNKVTGGVDDLIQQTFMSLAEGRGRLHDDSNFRSYLFGIAYNVLRGHLRARLRGRHIDPASSSLHQLNPGPSTMIAQSEEQRLLLLALRRIPLEYQVMLEMVYWEGLNAAEIAEALGVVHSTMRSRIRRARALLRDAIEELASSPELRKSTLDGFERWAAEVREMGT